MNRRKRIATRRLKVKKRKRKGEKSRTEEAKEGKINITEKMSTIRKEEEKDDKH